MPMVIIRHALFFRTSHNRYRKETMIGEEVFFVSLDILTELY
jgi:hypothetical protein